MESVSWALNNIWHDQIGSNVNVLHTPIYNVFLLLTESTTSDQLNQNDNHSEEAPSSLDSKDQLSSKGGNNADDQSNTTTSNVETSGEIRVGIQNSMEGTKQEQLLILKLEGDLIDNKLKSIIECKMEKKSSLSSLVFQE